MKVGVIILAFNLERYLRSAIDSAFDQTYQNFEILVVNDGSTDRTHEIVNSYGSKIHTICHNKNIGALPAHISGMAFWHHRVDILAFLDGDDVWEREKLSEVVKEFSENKQTILVTHDYTIIDKYGNFSGRADETQQNLKRLVTIENRESQSEYMKHSVLSYKGIWLGSAFCIRDRFLDLDKYTDWALSFPDAQLSHQDQPLAAFLIADQPEKLFGYVDKKLFRYRVFDENTSGASREIGKALNSIRRSRATILRTRQIAQNSRMPYELRRQNGSLARLDFAEALYTRKYSTALTALFQFWLSPFAFQAKVKELARLFGVLVLGRQRFLRLK